MVESGAGDWIVVRFVNPYTFVRQAPEPVRQAPAGHAVMGEGRFCGVIEVTLTAQTPLLIGGFPGQESGEPDVPRRSTVDRTAIVPGSGLMGAVRSMHEALAGGCLRVLDAGGPRCTGTRQTVPSTRVCAPPCGRDQG